MTSKYSNLTTNEKNALRQAHKNENPIYGTVDVCVEWAVDNLWRNPLHTTYQNIQAMDRKSIQS